MSDGTLTGVLECCKLLTSNTPVPLNTCEILKIFQNQFLTINTGLILKPQFIKNFINLRSITKTKQDF